jgi:ubiquinone biosynthesis accessory factor UbiJ
MIDQLASAAAVALLNRMLARESWARSRLEPFAGRIARFASPPFALELAVAPGGSFAVSDGGAAAVVVEFPWTSLPLALGSPPGVLKDLRLTGDAEFAQALGYVLQNLRPEPEEELSQFVGDIAAQRIVGALRAVSSHWRQLAEQMTDNAANYFVAENPLLVGRADIAAFTEDTHRLRDDVERLEKRIAELARR